MRSCLTLAIMLLSIVAIRGEAAIICHISSGPNRCAVCHEDLSQPNYKCPGCNTVLHQECSSELKRCPTLGCPIQFQTKAKEPSARNDSFAEFDGIDILLEPPDSPILRKFLDATYSLSLRNDAIDLFVRWLNNQDPHSDLWLYSSGAVDLYRQVKNDYLLSRGTPPEVISEYGLWKRKRN